MAIQITKKITGYEVVKPAEEAKAASAPAPAPESPIQKMDEHIERPETLEGTTYKIKTPLSQHALYVTINDIVLNPGTEHEQRRPFEIFINSKNMDHFQWIVALTRIISAVFRKGGDVTFLADELQNVFDPKGGYFKRGGKFMPSLVAEIGDCIDQHMRHIGMIHDELDEHQRKYLAEKRAEVEARVQTCDDATNDAECSQFPPGAQLCPKCNTKAMVQMDNCMTCLSCGESKCG